MHLRTNMRCFLRLTSTPSNRSNQLTNSAAVRQQLPPAFIYFILPDDCCYVHYSYKCYSSNTCQRLPGSYDTHMLHGTTVKHATLIACYSDTPSRVTLSSTGIAAAAMHLQAASQEHCHKLEHPDNTVHCVDPASLHAAAVSICTCKQEHCSACTYAEQQSNTDTVAAAAAVHICNSPQTMLHLRNQQATHAPCTYNMQAQTQTCSFNAYGAVCTPTPSTPRAAAPLACSKICTRLQAQQAHTNLLAVLCHILHCCCSCKRHRCRGSS